MELITENVRKTYLFSQKFGRKKISCVISPNGWVSSLLSSEVEVQWWGAGQLIYEEKKRWANKCWKWRGCGPTISNSRRSPNSSQKTGITPYWNGRNHHGSFCYLIKFLRACSTHLQIRNVVGVAIKSVVLFMQIRWRPKRWTLLDQIDVAASLPKDCQTVELSAEFVLAPENWKEQCHNSKLLIKVI